MKIESTHIGTYLVRYMNPPSPSRPSTETPSAAPFSRVLQNEVRTPEPLKFSVHAQKRLASRDIDLSDHEMTQLNHAVEKAAAKGARDALVLLTAIQRRREGPAGDFRSFMSVPLKHEDILIGVMNLAHSRPGAFTPATLKQVEDIMEPLVSLIMSLRHSRGERAVSASRETTALAEERLKAVRQTIVSLNREINNPLSVVILGADLLLQLQHGLDPTTRQQIETIKANAERIAHFLKRLSRIRTVAVKDYVPGVIEMLDVENSITGDVSLPLGTGKTDRGF